ncbi:hypothetical protein A6S26_33560 [Nostoc sp. ATCC 43529]|nr:hypothetical protein A6S26_33560 [Nostoc sp. ATCC 43529]
MTKIEVKKKLRKVLSKEIASSVSIGFTLGSLIIGFGILSIKPASAATVAGFSFDDNAFADTLISSFGDYTTSGGSLQSVLTDTDVGTYAFSFTPNASVQLGFTDNVLVNGAGKDLALFELGIPDQFKVSVNINGITNTYQSTGTEFSASGFLVNVATIDLDDFNIAAGSSLDSIIVGLDTISDEATVPSLSLVGALNSGIRVPEPSTILGSLAVGGIGAVLRRKQKQQQKAMTKA